MTQEQFFATTMDDLNAMTPDERAAWFGWEPEPIPLTSFRLDTDEWRQAFLREFYNVGWDWLFLAVNRVWDCLAEPRSLRCTSMGFAAGTGGTSKKALVKVLAKFLTEALDSIAPLPPRADFDSLDAWHEAAMATWQTDEANVEALVKKYSRILNGSSLKKGRAVIGQLILGPWTHS